MTRLLRVSAVAFLAAVTACTEEAVKPAPHPDQLKYAETSYAVPEAAPLRSVLKAGPAVYLAEDHELPTISIQILVRTGTYLDPKGKTGTGDLAGTVMRTGGTESLSPDELDDKLEFLAASLDVDVSLTQGKASLSILSKDLDEGLGLLVDVLRRPVFREDRFQLAKARMLEAMKARNDSTESVEDREFGILLYGADHTSNAFVTQATIDAIGREDLAAFHKKYFVPSNFIVAAAGDFRKDELLAKLEKAFGDWPGGKPDVPKIAKPSTQPAPGVYLFDKPEVNQGRVTLGHIGIELGNPDLFSVILMNYILGGGSFTSRLMSKVRSDEGLAYSIFSMAQPGVYYPGSFGIQFQSKVPTCAYASALCLEVLKKFMAEGVSQKELDEAKGYYFDSFPQRFATKAAIVQTFANDEYIERPPDFWKTYREKIRKVTVEDVKRVADTYWHPDQFITVGVGPVEALRKGDGKHPATLDTAGLGKIEIVPLPDPLTMERPRK